MSRRILTLVGYLLYRLGTSLSGLMFVAFAIAFYAFAFRTRTPESDYYVLVIGFFGAFITFLASLSLAARANEAQSYLILIRLNSRVEFLLAIVVAAFSFGLILQLLIAAVAMLMNGPDLEPASVALIPPVWISINILAAVLALHASDFVAAGWSRVWVFGILALFLIASDSSNLIANWLSEQARRVSAWSISRGAQPDSQFFQGIADWLNGDGGESFKNIVGFLFWPFRAIIDGVLVGIFTRTQALAPALLLIYATILFMLAADFFAKKDIFLAED